MSAAALAPRPVPADLRSRHGGGFAEMPGHDLGTHLIGHVGRGQQFAQPIDTRFHVDLRTRLPKDLCGIRQRPGLRDDITVTRSFVRQHVELVRRGLVLALEVVAGSDSMHGRRWEGPSVREDF